MHPLNRADIALRTGAAVLFAAGTISAVFLNNVPLGAGIGVVAGAVTLLLLWPRKNRSNANE
jgi:hypothetical protein